MIVTIDGPAGAGKSTVSRRLAERLGFGFLDTGAMFRAVALAAFRADCPLDNEDGLKGLLGKIQLEMRDGRVFLDGEDVSLLLRTPEISAASSRVAASANVRPYLADLQRKIAEGRDLVTEGRDQGTAVFPDAACKFFLTAAPGARMERRARELETGGMVVDRAKLLAEQSERDLRDEKRALAPLRPAEDALLIDSTSLSPDEVVARMERLVRDRQSR